MSFGAARALLSLQSALRANLSGWAGESACSGQWTGVVCAGDSRVISVCVPARLAVPGSGDLALKLWLMSMLALQAEPRAKPNQPCERADGHLNPCEGVLDEQCDGTLVC